MKVKTLLGIGLLCTAALAQGAEPFPSKAVRLVSALPPGADAYVRALGTRLAELMGQPFITDNKVGSSGVQALQSVATAPPDGHALLVHSPAFLITKNVQPSIPYDPVADFAAVAMIYNGGASILVVRGDSPVKSVEDLIARARAAPGKLTFGSGGVGFPAHLSAESFLKVAKAEALHVPFKSTAEYLQGLMRGDTDFSVAIATSAMSLIRSGRLRALGVATASRVRDLPDVPTLRELLKSDLLVQDFWAGLAAPAKTPPEVIRALNAATVKALSDPVVRRSIETPGNTPAGAETPEEFSAFIRRENDKWRDIVKLTGVKPE